MAIVNPQPVQANGQEYPFFGVSLAMSTRQEGSGMALALVVTLTPYRAIDGGIELFEEGNKVMVWGNALQQAQTDVHLAKFLIAIQEAGQAFVSEAL